MSNYTSDADTMACTAMHMTVGLMGPAKDYNFHDAYSDKIADEVGGFVGLIAELQQYAVESERILAERDPEDFPGVYDYEVSEPFGLWFGKHMGEIGEVPSVAYGKAKLAEMIVEFFRAGWISEANHRMQSRYGLTLADAGMGEDDIVREADGRQTPEEFVSWWGEKYDLDPIPQ